MIVIGSAMAATFCVSFILGIFFGCFLKTGAASAPVTVNVNVRSAGGDLTETPDVTVDIPQSESGISAGETENPQMVPISPEELARLKAQVEQDEADYGDNYQTFVHTAYKRKPDRIISKVGDQDGFHIYEKTNEHYEHLLKVAEDRMFYSAGEDFNRWCFTPDSVDQMMKSGEQYIIFDYDNDMLDRSDPGYQKDLIFRFTDQTRLYRLTLYLSYLTELVPRENLPKDEFAADTTVSGYKYMNSD